MYNKINYILIYEHKNIKNLFFLFVKYINNMFNTNICKPAIIFASIASIIILISFFIGILQRKFTLINSLSGLSSQFCCVIICTLILIGICNFQQNISWVLVIIFIICLICTIVNKLIRY